MITYSELAGGRKQDLVKEYPGIARHFDELENEIEKNPAAGTQELMANTGGRATPVRTMSTQTEIFGGVVSYSKELIAVYVCSDDMTAIRIVQFLF
jgi:hypothetical protein